jgi:hypothetical protein
MYGNSGENANNFCWPMRRFQNRNRQILAVAYVDRTLPALALSGFARVEED